jgi:hypothetical protein
MKGTKLISVIALFILSAFTAKDLFAQDKPIQVSLINPIQIFNENTSITGLRLNFIYGKNAKVSGLDWGLVNHITSGTSVGVQWGLVGIVESNYTGWQGNFLNITNGNFEGLQWGLINYAGTVSGVELGFINYAGTVSGVQFGLINYASNMTKGLQIGLINIIRHGGQFPFFPIVNWAL